MTNVFSALLRNRGRRKVYADLLQLDDHLLRDIGLTRTDIGDMIAGRGHKVLRKHD